MSTWKRILLCGVGIGIGATIAFFAIISTYSWYSSRPKPWNTNAITATFDRVVTEGDNNTYLFKYILQNNTKEDYTLNNGSDLVISAKLKKQKSIVTAKEDDLAIDLPVFIPANQKSAFDIHVNYPSKVKSTNGPDENERNKYREAVKNEVSKTLPNIDGFMIYEKQSKYQIDLPRGW